MTLWIFGDTYFQTNNNDSQWMTQLANHLETDLQALSKNGSALEFTYQRFNLARKKIKADDVIVIGLTDFDRRWFFKNYPEVAEDDCSPTGDKKENKAIKLFRKHLDHKEIHQVYLLDFLYNLESLVDEIGVHIIVIPNFQDTEDFFKTNKEKFPLLHIANGKLSNITNTELSKDENYLTLDNHKLLMLKLYNNIKNKESINL